MIFRNKIITIIKYFIVCVGVVIMICPFCWMVITSFTPNASLSFQSEMNLSNLSLEPYRKLFITVPFGRAIVNSIVIAVIGTVLQVVTSSMAAYVFARMPFRGRSVLFILYLTTMMIPFQVLLVPLFVEMKILGFVNSYFGVILPSAASAFGVFLLRQAMITLPHQLDEAATLDGAGHVRIFFKIILPLVRPALVTETVFAFLGIWNSFLWPLIILRDKESQTLPVALTALQGQYTTQWDILMAGSVISIIPMFLVYLFAQKYVVQGVAGVGIK
ncbi:carbohydrate ABC transporter permease [Mobiluncus mulieris]|uniref:ABC transporter, permease protein n=2 Tax=Mobiluncus mulieris TaxID=2052 RepID=E0QSV1_9ACTO|nr:carbohydrate ABC transporter permease [Mobiluncus mulieris]EEJ53632.1 ABC transporter, permease protein [Mobiluncus mulieris ATCC 35243]EFM45290.1 ABC transporter, permease protein [Mobiluncus mulieris ATCC 35239]MCU9969351.1 carbohydrate ABC transporter permease [Mobiluncus mulieris]MCU9975885.1 carbohydrate ABC transporter permease [Mobiluncus mulieris]MCV0012639.1 carbohydrate ABC transporter permease [Mobiluncus mulieris]